MSVGVEPPVVFSSDADGIGWIAFDNPGARANVFNPETLAALASAIDQAGKAKLKALVLISAKEKIFIAGADLKWLVALPDVATALELSRTGQQLFQRLTDFPVPVVCAIHGACAGGGFELALACHWRMATDAPATQIGLPETGIGTIPGWGGSVRLPRLIGAKPALDHILRAQLLPAKEALAAGLINELVVPSELSARARATALKLAAEGVPAAPPRPAAVPELFAELRRATLARTRGQQPALLAAIDAVEEGAPLPIPAALEVEARHFARVTVGDVCKNLVHVFFLRDAAKKRTLEGWFEGRAGLRPAQVGVAGPERAGQRPALPPIKKVGVVGAGVMGSGIAQWLAARGFEVVLRDVDPKLLERGMGVVRRLFDDSVKRGKLSGGDAAAGLARVATTGGWEGFKTCDLVLEAIVENVTAKQGLFGELGGLLPPEAILASNTSALPLEEIAGHVAHPERTIGIHFFNPVSRMPLVEIILAKETSAATAERALALVKALGKSPILCRSSPGFLVTRVLFFYLNAAVTLWEQGVPTAELDAALRDFGWPMGPLRLIDEVGVDVTDFIFGEMAHYFPDRFVRSTACGQMLAAGLKGRKNGEGRGFYRYDGGVETINDGYGNPDVGQVGDLACNSEKIVKQLMDVMVDEAERCLAEGVVKSADDVDFALLSGAGFPAFRGGLLRWARGR